MALRPPTGLFAFGTSDSAVVISWQPPEPVPVGYRVYRASGHHGAYTIVGTVDAPNMDTFTDASSLVAGMTYAYTVTAFNRQGESTPAGPVFVVMLAPPQASPTVGVPTPLPTFVPLAAPTLTALAHLPKVAATPTSHANATPGVPALLSGTATAGVVGRLPTGAAGALPGTPTPSITLSTSTPIPTILSPGAVPTIVPTPQP